MLENKHKVVNKSVFISNESKVKSEVIGPQSSVMNVVNGKSLFN